MLKPYNHETNTKNCCLCFSNWYNNFCILQKELSCENCGNNPPTAGTNKAPIAVAGPDQVITLPADSVLLDGNPSSDPDGTISAWLWAKTSGPVPY